MNILLVYKSKTDFTKKYAQIISQEIQCTVMEFKDVTADKMSNFNTIIFGGGLYAGKINKLKKVKEMFYKSDAKNLIIFATGGTPNKANEIIDNMWEQNLSNDELKSIPHFYMESGMCYEKMGLGDKAIMKMVGFMMSKNKNKDDYDLGFEQAITKSYDNSSKEHAQPLINYLKEHK